MNEPSAMRPRINRLEKLYAETLQELDKLGRNVDTDIRNFLSDSYKSTYVKNIFDLVKVGGLSVAIAKVENIHIEKGNKAIFDNERYFNDE